MNLYICGVADVAAIQEQYAITHTLSINDFLDQNVYSKSPDVRSAFHHIPIKDFENYDGPGAPDMETIRNIMGWIRTLQSDSNVLIHCFAGISRSTSVGLMLIYLITKDIDKSMEILRQIRPIAAPNRLISKLADVYLGHEELILYKAADKMCRERNLNDLTNDKR